MQRKINQNLIKMVTLLHDGHYHNGNQLGEALGLSRNAVWKCMQKLIAYGVAIESVKGKGYVLLEPLILLQPEKIKKSLEHKKAILTLFESLGSTNEYLKLQPQQKVPRFCLAEQQMQGRGRFKRLWHSPFAKNIYLSCAYAFQKDLSELAGLSLVVSLAVVKTLQSFAIRDQLYVKWPNDVLYGQQKLAGNLIEIQAESNGVSTCIIGIGLNVNMLEAEEITQEWTSMRQVTGQYLDRNQVVATLINDLLAYLNRFSHFGLADFLEEWWHSDCLANKNIVLQTANQKISGRAQGINRQGHLILRLADGKLQAFSSGDTSLLRSKAVNTS